MTSCIIVESSKNDGKLHLNYSVENDSLQNFILVIELSKYLPITNDTTIYFKLFRRLLDTITDVPQKDNNGCNTTSLQYC